MKSGLALSNFTNFKKSGFLSMKPKPKSLEKLVISVFQAIQASLVQGIHRIFVDKALEEISFRNMEKSISVKEEILECEIATRIICLL